MSSRSARRRRALRKQLGPHAPPQQRLPAGAHISARMPPGGTTTDLTPMVGAILAGQLAQLANGTQKTTPWPIPAEWQGSPFGPGDPLAPAAINFPRRDTGRPEPRFREYWVGENLQLSDHERQVPWDTLYKAAQQPLFRKCIERRKSICDLGFTVAVSENAIRQEALTSGRSQTDVEVELRRQFNSQINEQQTFLDEPDRQNGFDWRTWGSLIFENYLTYDALAIYPVMTYGGKLHSLRVTDGHLWKPLSDEYGNRPSPPYPAYQQIVWGFPRGDYAASTVKGDDGSPQYAGDVQSADTLFYERRHVRPGTLYGLPPTEVALIDGLLWTRRFQWMLAEYTEGVQPDSFLVNKGEVDWTPQQVIDYERFLNDRFGGNTASRMKWPMLPPGIEPVQSVGIGEKYRPDYDLFIIKLVAGDFGVPITELGFTETGALGATFHEGNEDVMYRQVRIPDAKWLAGVATRLLRRYNGMPRELEVKVLGLESEDEAAADTVAQAQVASGRRTMNEDRTRLGLPPYPFKEADMPMLQTQRGLIFIEDASKAGPAGTLIEPPHIDLAPGGGGQPTDPNRPDTDGVSAKTSTSTGTSTTPATVRKAIEAPPADPQGAVYAQLLPDYPASAMDWIHQMPWTGPAAIPLDQVDFAGQKSWNASHEPERVNAMADKIDNRAAQGRHVKPVILVKVPGHDKYRVIDGHHRALAYKSLNRPLWAFAGSAATATGPWDEFHTHQMPGDYDRTDSYADEPVAKQSAYQPFIDDRTGQPVSIPRTTPEGAELGRLRKFLNTRPNPARPFACDVLTRTHAEALCPDLLGSPHVQWLVKAGGATPKVTGPAGTTTKHRSRPMSPV